MLVDEFLAKLQGVKPDKRGRRQYRLRPGDPIPDWPPDWRWVDGEGYVVLSWRMGIREVIICREHRVVMGLPAGDVHHINHQRSDNRRENLSLLDASAHTRLHHPIGWDVAQAHKLYQQGWSLRAIAAQVSVSKTAVGKVFKKRGLPLRPKVRLSQGSLDALLSRFVESADAH